METNSAEQLAQVINYIRQDGMSRLGQAGIGERQLLMVVTDCFSNGETVGSHSAWTQLIVDAKRWGGEPNTNRSIISLFTGDASNGEACFRELVACNVASCFTRTPETLIEAFIDLAKSH